MTGRESVLKRPIGEIIGSLEQQFTSGETYETDFEGLIDRLVPHIRSVEPYGDPSSGETTLRVVLDNKVYWQPPWEAESDEFSRQFNDRFRAELARAAVYLAAMQVYDSGYNRPEMTMMAREVAFEASWLLDKNPFKDRDVRSPFKVKAVAVHDAINTLNFERLFPMPEKPSHREYSRWWLGAGTTAAAILFAACSAEDTPPAVHSPSPWLTETPAFVPTIVATTEVSPAVTPEDPVQPYPSSSGGFLLGAGGIDSDETEVRSIAGESVAVIEGFYTAELNRSGINPNGFEKVFVVNRVAEKASWAMVLQENSSGNFWVPRIKTGFESEQLMRSLMLGGDYFSLDFGANFFDLERMENPPGVAEQKLVGDQSGWNVIVGYDVDGRAVKWANLEDESWDWIDGFLPSGAVDAEYDGNDRIWVAFDSAGNPIMRFEGNGWVLVPEPTPEMPTYSECGKVIFEFLTEEDIYGQRRPTKLQDEEIHNGPLTLAEVSACFLSDGGKKSDPRDIEEGYENKVVFYDIYGKPHIYRIIIGGRTMPYHADRDNMISTDIPISVSESGTIEVGFVTYDEFEKGAQDLFESRGSRQVIFQFYVTDNSGILSDHFAKLYRNREIYAQLVKAIKTGEDFPEEVPDDFFIWTLGARFLYGAKSDT